MHDILWKKNTVKIGDLRDRLTKWNVLVLKKIPVE